MGSDNLIQPTGVGKGLLVRLLMEVTMDYQLRGRTGSSSSQNLTFSSLLGEWLNVGKLIAQRSLPMKHTSKPSP